MYSTKYVKAKDVSIAASIVADAEDGKFFSWWDDIDSNNEAAVSQSRLSR